MAYEFNLCKVQRAIRLLNHQAKLNHAEVDWETTRIVPKQNRVPRPDWDYDNDPTSPEQAGW